MEEKKLKELKALQEKITFRRANLLLDSLKEKAQKIFNEKDLHSILEEMAILYGEKPVKEFLSLFTRWRKSTTDGEHVILPEHYIPLSKKTDENKELIEYFQKYFEKQVLKQEAKEAAKAKNSAFRIKYKGITGKTFDFMYINDEMTHFVFRKQLSKFRYKEWTETVGFITTILP